MFLRSKPYKVENLIPVFVVCAFLTRNRSDDDAGPVCRMNCYVATAILQIVEI